MSNLPFSRKFKKKLKNLTINKNSDDRVYKFEESSFSESPPWIQIFGKKNKGRKYQPSLGSPVGDSTYQANSVSTSTSTTDSTVTDSDPSFHNESIPKVNNNTFFRNGWVTNLHLEETRNLISEEILSGYGAIQNEPKIDHDNDIGVSRNCEVIATVLLKSLD